MMRVVADGKAAIAVEEPAGRIFQAGSQRVTSAAYQKGGIHSMVAHRIKMETSELIEWQAERIWL